MSSDDSGHGIDIGYILIIILLYASCNEESRCNVVIDGELTTIEIEGPDENIEYEENEEYIEYEEYRDD